MFADDTKVFKAIKSPDDAASLQADLNHLEAWSSTSGLAFNETKCKSQSITRKIKPIVSTYKLNNSTLETTDTERDLGVWVANNLTWNKQVHEQSACARQTPRIHQEEHTAYSKHRSETHVVSRSSTISIRVRHTSLGAAVNKTYS